MRNISHGSWVKVVSEAVEAWRVRENWSRETVCAEFVDEFKNTERQNAWNIEFSNHADVFQRQKNDADKIMRWLDDVNKDNNLLGLNFSKVILRRLPLDLRIRAAAEIMADIGLHVHMTEDSEDAEPSISDVFSVQIESTKALQLATIALQDPTEENLQLAELQMSTAFAKGKRLGKLFEKLKSKVGKAKGVCGAALGKFVHRKEKVAK